MTKGERREHTRTGSSVISQPSPVQLVSPFPSSVSICVSDVHNWAFACQQPNLPSQLLWKHVCSLFKLMPYPRSLVLKTASPAPSWLSRDLFHMEFAQDAGVLHTFFCTTAVREWGCFSFREEIANWGFLRRWHIVSSPGLEVRMKQLCGLTPPTFSEHKMAFFELVWIYMPLWALTSNESITTHS